MKRVKYVSPEDMLDAVTAIAEMAREQGIRVALVGGFALHYYGSDRLTVDVDLLASGEIEGLPNNKSLTFGGYQTTAPNGVPVDIIIRSDEYSDLYSAALRDAEASPELPVRIVSCEYIAAMKMVAGRTKDTVDLEFLLQNCLDDGEATRAVVRKFLGKYAVQEFNSMADEAAWKATLK